METGDGGQRVVRLDDEHKREGKAAKQGAADVLVDCGELLRIGAHPLDRLGISRGSFWEKLEEDISGI